MAEALPSCLLEAFKLCWLGLAVSMSTRDCNLCEFGDLERLSFRLWESSLIDRSLALLNISLGEAGTSSLSSNNLCSNDVLKLFRLPLCWFYRAVESSPTNFDCWSTSFLTDLDLALFFPPLEFLVLLSCDASFTGGLRVFWDCLRIWPAFCLNDGDLTCPEFLRRELFLSALTY